MTGWLSCYHLCTTHPHIHLFFTQAHSAFAKPSVRPAPHFISVGPCETPARSLCVPRALCAPDGDAPPRGSLGFLNKATKVSHCHVTGIYLHPSLTFASTMAKPLHTRWQISSDMCKEYSSDRKKVNRKYVSNFSHTWLRKPSPNPVKEVFTLCKIELFSALSHRFQAR